MRYWTSDTHFGHARIIDLCARPFNGVSHMNETLIKNWNDTVAPDDEVFHLGDVALGPWIEWDSILTRLNGHIALMVGNHDRIFKGMREKEQLRFGEHYARWFEIIADEATGIPVEPGLPLVNMSHFPYDGDSHGEDRYADYRLEDKGVPLIHGHTHGRDQRATVSSKGTPQFHVGVDAWDFKPVPETEIVDWLRSL